MKKLKLSDIFKDPNNLPVAYKIDVRDPEVRHQIARTKYEQEQTLKLKIFSPESLDTVVNL